MKNTLSDLNNHLFEQLERLNDEELIEERLDSELRRAEGMPSRLSATASWRTKPWCTWLSTAMQTAGEAFRRCWR